MHPQILHSHKDPEARGVADIGQCGDETLPLLQSPTQVSHSTSTEIQGYLLMVLSSIFYSLMSTFVYIAEQKVNLPIVSASFFRGLVPTVLTFLYIAVFLPFPGTFSNLSRQQMKLLTLRSLSGSFSVIFFFASLEKLPLGEAVTICFCSPAFVMILSNIFLGEPVTLVQSIAGVLCFIGVYLVGRPESGILGDVSSHDRIIGCFYGFIAAILFAISDVTVRGLGTSIHYMVSVFSFCFILTLQTILMGIATSPVEFWNFRRAGVVSALIAGFISFPALGCLNRGLQLCRAGPGSVIRTLDVPISYTLGLVFLDESLSLSKLLGSALVTLGTLIIGLRQVLQP